MAALKPWHYILIGVVCCLFALLIPLLSYLARGEKTRAVVDAVDASTAGQGGGVVYTPPAWPAPPVEKVASRAENPPQPAPQPERQLVSPRVEPTLAPRASAPPDLRMFGDDDSGPATTPPPSGAAAVERSQYAAAGEGTLGSLLKPTELGGYRATRLRKPWATIQEGRIIACNTVTPLTSGLPGFVKAKVSRDEWSADDSTPLIDRNSDIYGEIAHGLISGQDRLFVLWRRIETPKPNFVRITINSPAADELGEAGLPGDIDHHTWQKIGGALLLSGIDAGLQGAMLGLTSAMSHGGNSGYGGGLNFYQFQGQGQSLAGSLLNHTISIPDTLHRDQAMPCSIFVSGDLLFDDVYALRRKRR